MKEIMSGDDFFNLINNEDNYKTYINNKIDSLNEEFFRLSDKQQLEKIMNILEDFQIFGREFDLLKLPVANFLNQYDKYIPADQKVKTYFCLNNYSLAEDYIKKNYDELKSDFRNKYIVFSDFDHLSIIPTSDLEYEDKAYYLYGEESINKKVYIVPSSYNTESLNYLLFKYFRKYITFLYPYGAEDPWKGFYFDLSWKYYKKMLIDLDKEGEKELVKELIFSVNFEKNLKEKEKSDDYFENFNIIEIFSKLIQFLGSNTSFLKYYSLFLDDEKYILKTSSPSREKASKVLSKNFFSNLKYLNNLPKSEWHNDPIYQDDLSLFYDFLQHNYAFDISEYRHIIRRVFNRLISGQSIFDILKINSLSSLLHYYKTGEIFFIANDEISTEIVKKYITWEYFDIKKDYQSKSENESSKVDIKIYYQEGKEAIKILKILSFFGYQRAKKILKSSLNLDIIENIADSKFQSLECKKKFIEVIFNDLSLFIETIKNQKDIERVITVFEDLFNQNYKPLKLSIIFKRVANFECYLLPSSQKILSNLLLLNYVSKGEPLENKINGIKLYNDYRFRSLSSIPDIEGKKDYLEYSTVDMHSPAIISNGIGEYMYPNDVYGSSCLTPVGKAASCMEHGALNVHGRFFQVMYQGKIVAYSWVWRAGDIICFDNIEVTKESKNIPNSHKAILDIYKKASREIINISEQFEKRPIRAAIIGKNHIDILSDEIEKLPIVKEFFLKNFKPNNSDGLYLKDSEENQYLLEGNLDNSINTDDCEAVYRYQRPSIKSFDDTSLDYLKTELNSIYFDYCLYTHTAYEPLKLTYKSIIVGEDWFIGYKNDGTYDLYYANPNEEMLKEIQQYIDLKRTEIKKTNVYVNRDYSCLDYYLNDKSYIINKEDLEEYLANIKNVFKDFSINDYFHSTNGDMENFGHILLDNAITSAVFGCHKGGYGKNGSHFISVAELNSESYNIYSKNEGFVISDKICAFKTGVLKNSHFDISGLINSRCPIRPYGLVGEAQVLDYISLDFVKCLTIDPKELYNIAKILYIQEFTQRDLPMVTKGDFLSLDKSELKRLIRLK